MHESERGKWSHSVMSYSLQPHGLQPTRPLCPWDFPGKVLECGASAFSIWVYTQWQFIKNPVKYKRGGRLQTKGTPCRIPVHNTEKKGRVLEVMSIFHPACLRACCLISGSSAEPHDFSLLEKHPLAPNWAPIQSWSLVHHAALSSVFLSPVGD